MSGADYSSMWENHNNQNCFSYIKAHLFLWRTWPSYLLPLGYSIRVIPVWVFTSSLRLLVRIWKSTRVNNEHQEWSASDIQVYAFIFFHISWNMTVFVWRHFIPVVRLSKTKLTLAAGELLGLVPKSRGGLCFTLGVKSFWKRNIVVNDFKTKLILTWQPWFNVVQLYCTNRKAEQGLSVCSKSTFYLIYCLYCDCHTNTLRKTQFNNKWMIVWLLHFSFH